MDIREHMENSKGGKIVVEAGDKNVDKYMQQSKEVGLQRIRECEEFILITRVKKGKGDKGGGTRTMMHLMKPHTVLMFRDSVEKCLSRLGDALKTFMEFE